MSILQPIAIVLKIAKLEDELYLIGMSCRMYVNQNPFLTSRV